MHKYFAALSERWKVLTPQHVALDDMFAAFLEDLVCGLFNIQAEPEKMPALLDKFWKMASSMARLPDHGRSDDGQLHPGLYAE